MIRRLICFFRGHDTGGSTCNSVRECRRCHRPVYLRLVRR